MEQISVHSDKKTGNYIYSERFHYDAFGKNKLFYSNGKANRVILGEDMNGTGIASLEFKKDGTFVLNYTDETKSDMTGTYQLEDEILTLHVSDGEEEKEYVFIYENDALYFDVYEKESESSTEW